MNNHQKHGVIANNIGQSQAVINNTKSENRRAFDAWATVFSKSEKDRQRYMQNDTYAMCLWWLRRDKEFRAYLLFRACGEDAGRYTDAAWSALPEGVRREIALACRRVARDAQGCAWW